MDRDQIQRQDFPTGRRGYDTAAVDEHLRRVAEAFQAPPTLAGAASERVREILEAAEHSAADLRARASEEASEHVARVRSGADGMLAKLDALELELGQLLAALRTSGERLVQGLAELQGEVARGAEAAAPPLPVEEDVAPPAAPADEAGARLIALNMALSGSPREATARYLADHFAIVEPDELLDDVYARAGQ